MTMTTVFDKDKSNQKTYLKREQTLFIEIAIIEIVKLKGLKNLLQ